MRFGTSLALLTACLAAPAAAGPKHAEMVEMEVKDVYTVPHGGANVVLLKVKRQDLYLPIWIGSQEALAITLRLTGRKPPRPLTHDLMERVLGSLGAKVVKIHIEDLRGHVFIGRVFLRQRKRIVDLDARPSDSIALAVGAGAPIYAARDVLDRAGISEKDARVGRFRPLPKIRTEGSL